MRIGIDIRSLMENRTTGVQVYVKNLLGELFRIDQKNEYCLFANSFGNVERILPEYNFDNVTTKVFHYPNKLFVPAQKLFGRPKIDKILGDCDLFFSPHWRVAPLTSGIPLVVTFHDLSVEAHPEFFTTRQRFWYHFMDYRKAAGMAAKIIAVSESTKSDLMKYYQTSEDKVRVIYPGARLARQMSEPKNVLPKNFFLHLGTHGPRKNIESILLSYTEYFRKSSVKRSLVLAGSQGWKTKLQVPTEIASSVYIIQDISEEEKLYLYCHAFAFLFLSFYEGFGFPIVEAASLGLPVISSFATSLAEIGSDFALLVNPLRPSQVASAMLELERDKAYYTRMKDRGLRASQKFTWSQAAEQTLSLFEECAHV